MVVIIQNLKNNFLENIYFHFTFLYFIKYGNNDFLCQSRKFLVSIFSFFILLRLTNLCSIFESQLHHITQLIHSIILFSPLLCKRTSRKGTRSLPNLHHATKHSHQMLSLYIPQLQVCSAAILIYFKACYLHLSRILMEQ